MHNSYLVVIRKRIGPVPEVQVNFGSQDFLAGKLVPSRDVDIEEMVASLKNCNTRL
jgi:hypothetical protein